MSKIAKIIIPVITVAMDIYCFNVSFSFKKNWPSNNDKTQYDPTIGADIVELPDIANT